MRRCYRNLKISARRRGKAFDLTFEQFQTFAVETDYINKRGIQAYDYTIDRKDNKRGYVIDNIAILTNSQNASKGTKVETPF